MSHYTEPTWQASTVDTKLSLKIQSDVLVILKKWSALKKVQRQWVAIDSKRHPIYEKTGRVSAIF